MMKNDNGLNRIFETVTRSVMWSTALAVAPGTVLPAIAAEAPNDGREGVPTAALAIHAEPVAAPVLNIRPAKPVCSSRSRSAPPTGLRGTRERLPSILVSSATIVAVLLPIVAFGGSPGLEIVQLRALAIIDGLLASTLATLFVIPALYLITGAGAGRQSDLGLARE